MSSLNPDFRPGSPNIPVLHRSASFCGITLQKRVVIEEHLMPSPTGTTIFRQCRYEEVSHSPGKEKPGAVHFLRHCVSETHIPTAVNQRELPKILPIICQPNSPLPSLKPPPEAQTNSDINTNSESKTAPPSKIEDSLNLARDEDKEMEYTSVRKRIRRMKVKMTPSHADSLYSPEASSQHNYIRFCILIVIVSFTTLCGLFTFFHITCNLDFNIAEVKETLSSKLFGQEAVVNDIVSALEEFYSSKEPKLKMLLVTGTSGVGKTYTVSLLQEQFPWKQNIHHLVMPLKSEALSHPTNNDFSSCGDNLVVVDSLLKRDVDAVIEFAKYLSIASEHKRIFALFIFSLPHPVSEELKVVNVTAESLALHDKFKIAGVNVTLVKFLPLQENHVKSCIKEVLTSYRYSYSDYQINNILKHIKILQEGCKRVVSKTFIHMENKKTEL